MSDPYRILERKRAGEVLAEEEIRALVRGAVDGSWTEGQLAAFLMAAAIRGMDGEETRALTLAMLESGERWDLDREIPLLGDKHSTGGVGDKVSLILSPLLASCGQPVVMLTGRALGHTGGTADKLETIPGLDLELDREDCLRLLREVGMAIGVATRSIAPADRRFYALRDATATVDSKPLITASILSKKLATGAAALVFDVKTGGGAFLTGLEEARRLGRMLVETATSLGRRSSALITDMSQPLGDWVGHSAEVRESLECLEGGGPAELREVVLALAHEVCLQSGSGVGREELEGALEDGRARRVFERWVVAQGGDAEGLVASSRQLAPSEIVLEAPEGGFLAEVDARALGLLLGGAAAAPGGGIDPGVAMRYRTRLGRRLERGEELARLYLREPDEELASRALSCFKLAPEPAPAPDLIRERLESEQRS